MACGYKKGLETLDILYFFEVCTFNNLILERKEKRKMSFIDVTDIKLNEEIKELEEILSRNEKAREACVQFEAECKLRKELVEARKEKNIT